MEARNPFVFVLGCQRSGTSLLQQMLDAHPQLAVTCDTEFIPRVLPADAPADGRLDRDTVERAIAYRTRSGRAGFDHLELPAETARRLAERADTYAQFVTLLFDEVAATRGKVLAGDKTPDYSRHVTLLHELFPEARFVDIVRDGRDVALSMLRWAKTGPRGPVRTHVWDENPVAACALWWSDMVRLPAKAGARAPGHYLRIRYEDLIAQPEAVLRQVTDFLGLPFAAEMLRYHQGKPQVRRPGETSNLPPTAGLRDWRTQMEAADVEVFESLAGDLLEELGYTRALTAIGAEAAARAERWRRRWAKKYGSG
jgi:Sulfotransferase family